LKATVQSIAGQGMSLLQEECPSPGYHRTHNMAQISVFIFLEVTLIY